MNIKCKSGAFRLLLLLLALSAVLSSCGIIILNHPGDNTEILTNKQGETIAENTSADTVNTNTPVTPVTPADNEKIAQKYLDALKSRDFEGVGVVIATLSNTLFTPDNNDKPITTARLMRNRAVEKKYNTIIMSNVCANIDVMLTEAKEAQKSGMYYADMLAIPSVNLGAFKTEELLFNLNSLPFTDYTAPYYNKDAMKQMSGGYNVYGAAGELTEDLEYMYLMFFNKTIIKKYGIEDPYILVEDGKWTWDKLREIIITVNDDINASGGIPIAGHASQTDTNAYINMMFASTGQHYMTTGVGNIPSVSYNTQSTNKLIETAHKLLYEDGTYYNESDNTDPALTAFNNGNVLFYVNSLYATSGLLT
jgi:ABC-type glycerol-3-phosphate transport system substrate-binding protein